MLQQCNMHIYDIVTVGFLLSDRGKSAGGAFAWGAAGRRQANWQQKAKRRSKSKMGTDRT